jgi:hypothetical protein
MLMTDLIYKLLFDAVPPEAKFGYLSAASKAVLTLFAMSEATAQEAYLTIFYEKMFFSSRTWP